MVEMELMIHLRVERLEKVEIHDLCLPKSKHKKEQQLQSNICDTKHYNRQTDRSLDRWIRTLKQ